METLHYEILINAPVETVYTTLTSPKGFRAWSSEFSPTSRYKGKWTKGSNIRFLSDQQDGTVCGLISQVHEHIKYRHISLLHIGVVQDDKDIIGADHVNSMNGLNENYTFISRGNKTIVQIDTDTLDEHLEYFKDSWPKALVKLKIICEQQV